MFFGACSLDQVLPGECGVVFFEGGDVLVVCLEVVEELFPGVCDCARPVELQSVVRSEPLGF